MDALEWTDANLERIRLAGDVEGTFYLDDMRLVPEEVPEPLEPTAVAASEGSVRPCVERRGGSVSSEASVIQKTVDLCARFRILERQKAEGRRQKADVRRQISDVRCQKADVV